MSASAAIAALPSQYRLKYTTAVRVLHVISVDMDVTVEVFGDPDNAAYEWLIRRGGTIERHSNDGYGMSAVALRDGLNAWFQ